MSRFKTNKKVSRMIILITLILIFALTGRVLAKSISGDNVIIGSEEVLEKTSFISGNSIRIDGDINSTTFATGGNVELNGNIDGDLFIASQSVIINGEVTGSVFIISQDMVINGLVENNIYLVGAELKLNSETRGGAFLAGQNIYIENGAEIEKDTFIGGSEIYQNGIINRDLTTSSQLLSIGGKIGGDLNYTSENQAAFSDDSEVLGEVNWKEVEVEGPKPIISLGTLYSIVISVLSSLAIWFFIRLIRPSFWNNLAERVSNIPLKTLGFGAIALMVTPIVLVVLLITVIGVPLSFILLALYVILIYISKIIISRSIGYYFEKKFELSKIASFAIFVLGLISLSFLGKIPILSWIFGLIVSSIGIGSIVVLIKDTKEKEIISS